VLKVKERIRQYVALVGRKPISWHFHGLVETMKALRV
jgi:hypothetical protein